MFRSDPKLAETAAEYAKEAIEVARRKMGLTLDGTAESIREVERFLGALHDAVTAENATDEEIDYFAIIFGSYLGEVIRHHHGGEWGWLRLQDQEWPGLSLGIWPLLKAKSRILNGAEQNVWHYYQILFTTPGGLPVT